MGNCVGILLFMLPTVVGLIIGKNGTETYLWWCKLTYYCGDVGFALSILTLCLASIDRYHATSRNVLRRQRSSMKVAKISSLVVILTSLLLSIPDLLYYYIDNSFGEPMCINVSAIYYIYYSYFVSITVYSMGPLILLIIFGILTYHNLKSIQHVTPHERMAVTNVGTAGHSISNFTGAPNNDNNNHVIIDQQNRQKKMNISKQRIDGQFSMMLILQILCFSIATLPVCIKFAYSTITMNYPKSDMSQAIEGLFTAITYVLSSTPFCISFYVYYVSSSTYRRNVKKILWKKRQAQISPTVRA
ncbi:unnamed protein product [Adineta steineri]|uniref:G-protein coupled receptors family 1 profile domain-containing protein n=1 Tax=Adineta steineri TaxID=433720 RepID=A0A819PJC0_9BILA|nr:unnamed protein product [Adineta steineri]CAF4018137.1 unnamed protein product [Adineta steineri]